MTTATDPILAAENAHSARWAAVAAHLDVLDAEKRLRRLQTARRQAILRAVDTGMSVRAIARETGMSPSRVSQIVRGVR